MGTSQLVKYEHVHLNWSNGLLNGLSLHLGLTGWIRIWTYIVNQWLLKPSSTLNHIFNLPTNIHQSTPWLSIRDAQTACLTDPNSASSSIRENGPLNMLIWDLLGLGHMSDANSQEIYYDYGSGRTKTFSGLVPINSFASVRIVLLWRLDYRSAQNHSNPLKK